MRQQLAQARGSDSREWSDHSGGWAGTGHAWDTRAMAVDAFICGKCGNRFSLPDAVRAKYPNWTPTACMDCRDSPATKGAGAGGKSATKGRRTVTATTNLPVAEVLARFTEGPTSGVFTDGSCQPNPGPGGWGAVYVSEGVVFAERHGYDPQTTNNRMELTAMIAGLEMLGVDNAVDVYSDSALVVNTLTKWAKGWEARGWKRKEGPVLNLDLVQRAYALLQERPRVNVEWVRAHDGSRWNEYADALSTAHLRDVV